jgi:hypothetical protein
LAEARAKKESEDEIRELKRRVGELEDQKTEKELRLERFKRKQAGRQKKGK